MLENLRDESKFSRIDRTHQSNVFSTSLDSNYVHGLILD